jgi:hypothetical protein
MKTFLILTGPQGSGNHLWSKVLSLHPSVYGWRDLTEEYWIGHDREPFNDCWKNTDLLKKFDWSQSNFYVSSISAPYMENGEPRMPPINKFGATLESLGIRVIYCIIGRDKNILAMQEQRLRDGVTYPKAVELYSQLPLDNTYFLSHELLILYQKQYLAKISKDLEFPIEIQSEKIDEFLKDNSNKKYLSPVDSHWVDDLARQSSRKWK